MKNERQNGVFSCAACGASITGWLKRLDYPSRSLLNFYADQFRYYMRYELVPYGHYALSDDMPWDKIDAPEPPPQVAMIFSESDTYGLNVDPASELDQYGGFIKGTYGPNMSCDDCGKRIGTCVRNIFSVDYVYVPLSNLRYQRNTNSYDNLRPKRRADIEFSGTDAGCLILIVDGVSERRAERKIFLEKLGYRIIEAENGEEGVATANRGKPMLILMNFELAGMNGTAAAKLIRAQSNEQVIILMDSKPDDIEMRRQAWDGGCNEYLEEPCFKLELLELIKRYILLLRKASE